MFEVDDYATKVADYWGYDCIDKYLSGKFIDVHNKLTDIDAYINSFCDETGGFPENLKELIKYYPFMRDDMFIDPWGHCLVYKLHEQERGSYELYSVGLNGHKIKKPTENSYSFYETITLQAASYKMLDELYSDGIRLTH